MSGSKLTDSKAALAFIFAGKAIFTLRSTKSGAHYTYKMQEGRKRTLIDPTTYFLKVLVGADNTTDYAYVGFVRGGRYVHGNGKARLPETAESVVAFKWALAQLQNGTVPDTLEIWHEGRCGRCGRRLTVPSSIATGLGPECAGKVGIPTAELPLSGNVGAGGEPVEAVESRAAKRFPEASNFAEVRETPDAFFQRKVKELSAELPGVTFGYIGNVYGSYGTPRWRDDRSWAVFIPHPGRVGTYEDSVSLGRTGDLPKAVEKWDGIAERARRLYHNGSVRVEMPKVGAAEGISADSVATMVEYKRAHDPEGFTMGGVLDESEAQAFWTKRFRDQPLSAEEMK